MQNLRIALMLESDGSTSFGGMEVHGQRFELFFKERDVLKYAIGREHLSCRDANTGLILQFQDVQSIGAFLAEQGVGVLFFNSGHWIEDIPLLRRSGLESAKFIMRSGGNEIVKAPWSDMMLALSFRQKLWADVINDNVDFLVVNSTYSMIRACNLGICKDLIVVARGGVDLQACEENKRLRQKNRKDFVHKYDCGGATLLGIVSRLEPFKGILPVLSILKRCQHLDWHLVIAGDGSEKNKILKYLRSQFPPKKYSYIGNVDHSTSMRIISLVDWILNCSLEFERKSGEDYYIHTETMGRTMIESICQGTPIVATSVGGIRELFYENDFPGTLLSSSESLEPQLPKIVSDRYRVVPTRAVEMYSWQSIFDDLYMSLIALPPAVHVHCVLVVDIDGTVAHDFLELSDNASNISRILGLRRKCTVILNTARGYAELLKAYPSVDKCKDELCIIAECGGIVSVFGRFLCFGQSLPGLSKTIEKEVENRIIACGCVWNDRHSVNRMYVNYKVKGDVVHVESHFNSDYVDLGFGLCHNERNLKIVSRHVNKGRALGFVLRHCVCPEFVVGAGNNILDIPFLEYCDRRYLVNYELNVAGCMYVRVNSQRDMDEFLQRVEDDVCKA